MKNFRKRVTADGKIRFQFRIRRRGFPPLSKTFDRKTDGDAWVQEQTCAMRAGTFIDTRTAEVTTVSELIETFIKETFHERRSLHTPHRTLSWWKSRIGHVPIAKVTKHLIKHHWISLSRSLSEHTGKPLSNRTLNAYLETLSACFSYAVEEDLLVKNPILNISKRPLKNSRTRTLSEDERERLFQAAKDSSNRYLYPAMLMSISTGGRRGEVMGLTWKDVNLKTGEVFFRKTKNDMPRTVVLSPSALEALLEVYKVRSISSDLIFSPLKPRRNGHDHVPWEDLKAPFRRACASASIEDFRWHDLRHCAASYLMTSGATLPEAMKILGHKSAAMSWRYSHLDTKRMTELARKVDDEHLRQKVA